MYFDTSSLGKTRIAFYLRGNIFCAIEKWESAVMTPMCTLAQHFMKLSASQQTVEEVSKIVAVKNTTVGGEKTGRRLTTRRDSCCCESAGKHPLIGRDAQERFCCELCHSMVILGRRDWEAHLKVSWKPPR